MTKLKRYQIYGIIFTIIVGTLLHFIYQWSGENSLAAIIGPVNESVWEHLKMLLWPMLAFGIWEYFAYGRDINNFIPVKVLSIIIGLVTIPVLFYAYTGVIGNHNTIIDILIFIIAVVIAYIFSYYQLKSREKFNSRLANKSAIIALLILIACFVVFTFLPPHIGIFYDTVKGLYGIPK